MVEVTRHLIQQGKSSSEWKQLIQELFAARAQSSSPTHTTNKTPHNMISTLHKQHNKSDMIKGIGLDGDLEGLEDFLMNGTRITGQKQAEKIEDTIQLARRNIMSPMDSVRRV
ncbi:hypothetical protein DPMN_011443 [Dreissena polymorpha]|uniref:Uncharacterized protein n=1 Tax=Dreissena polymorpha TaxID=45954 RepID=A0A9D4N411_DREPO|nr:hypothetical protein DPMN_011443 [Dreissena polymorpha]